MKQTRPNVLSNGTGTPVVLLHSSMSSKLQWYRLMQSLSRNYHCLAIDLYGYGDTPLPANTQNFSLADEVALVESLLTDLIAPDQAIHLVGHSYGAAVALRYCFQNSAKDSPTPSRTLRSLSLFEPVSFHLLPENDGILQETMAYAAELQNLMKSDPRQAASLFIDRWSGWGTFASFPAEMKELLAGAAQKIPLDYHGLIKDSMTLDDCRGLLTPVCLLAGRQSPPAAPHIARLLASHLPHCQFHLVEGGHMSPVYQPHLVNPIIESFIREH